MRGAYFTIINSIGTTTNRCLKVMDECLKIRGSMFKNQSGMYNCTKYGVRTVHTLYSTVQ